MTEWCNKILWWIANILLFCFLTLTVFKPAPAKSTDVFVAAWIVYILLDRKDGAP